jgi:hypothetical protein
MNIVPDRGAIEGIVVGTTNGEVRDLAQQSHHCPRNQMGFRVVAFANLTGSIGATGVEVSEANRIEAIGCR